MQSIPRLRYSAWRNYMQCPYVFHQRYILGKEQPDNEKMARGREVERLFDEFIMGPHPEESDALEYQMAHAAWESFRSKIDWSELLEVKRQHVLHADLTVGDIPIEIKCTPDYVCMFRDKIILVDLKTCQSYGQWNEKKALEDDQLNLYGWLVAERFRRPTEAFYLVVNAEDLRVRWLPSKNDPAMFLQKLHRAAKGIRDEDWSASKSWMCKFCEHYGQCPATKKEEMRDEHEGV